MDRDECLNNWQATTQVKIYLPKKQNLDNHPAKRKQSKPKYMLAAKVKHQAKGLILAQDIG